MKHSTTTRVASPILAALLALCLSAPAFAAAPASEPPLDEVLMLAAEQDVSAILRRHDEVGSYPADKNAGALGVIGNEGRRFRIRFLSLSRVPDMPLHYAVTGKTKVGDTVRDFTGTIGLIAGRLLPRTPENADQYGSGHAEGELKGSLWARLVLTENPSQPDAGRIEGTLHCDVKRQADGKLVIDETMLGADGYANNQFVGQWTGYKTGAVKPVNFGALRIPHEGLPDDLEVDSGVGEFIPSEKLAADPSLGWTDYRVCKFGMRFPKDYSDVEAACERETREWWR